MAVKSGSCPIGLVVLHDLLYLTFTFVVVVQRPRQTILRYNLLIIQILHLGGTTCEGMAVGGRQWFCEGRSSC